MSAVVVVMVAVVAGLMSKGFVVGNLYVIDILAKERETDCEVETGERVWGARIDQRALLLCGWGRGFAGREASELLLVLGHVDVKQIARGYDA
jgi:hypothetical protein